MATNVRFYCFLLFPGFSKHLRISSELTFTIEDANEATLPVSKFIVINAVNDAPTIQLASASSYATSAAETMTSFSVSAGIERFFSISDFGYQDVEGNPLDSISIELPSSSIGTLYLGSGDYNTDGIDLALTEGLNDDGTSARVSRTDIEAGKLYFLAAQTAIGKSVTFEFDVFDGDLDSEVPGLFEFNVIGAPKSADETIRDAQYKAEFELIIGEGRYEAIKPVINNEGVTLDEALEILVAHQDEQDALSAGTVFAYNQMSEASFRWQIGWYRIEDVDNADNTVISLTFLT